MRSCFPRATLLGLGCGCFGVVATLGSDWPQWRGLQRDGATVESEFDSATTGRLKSPALETVALRTSGWLRILIPEQVSLFNQLGDFRGNHFFPACSAKFDQLQYVSAEDR